MTFDQVLSVGRLRELLASGTGKGVKVGILDSGVASALPDLGGRVVSNYEVTEDRYRGTRIVPLEQGVDVIEHGTACAYIIHRHAPDAELHSVRVIGQSHNSTTGKLLAALEFAVEQGWDILNLSLGTEASYERIARLADLAYYRGQIWIAAKDNKRNKVGYPAGLASVVGVDMDFFEAPALFRYHPDRETEVEASGVYVEAPTSDGGRQQFTGTSFACPQITGLAARLRQHFPDLTSFQLKTALAALRENRD
ncbi:MAG TPA: S8 family serine peptidase [Bacteroidia bacterium]|nr:S8 family serine peptidase [Bacteroidia bacterium]